MTSTIEAFICIDCVKKKPIQHEGGTGYGIDPDTGDKVCYVCCGYRDQAEMILNGRATLYLSNGVVSNWPSSYQVKPIDRWQGKHNMGGVVYFVRFIGPDGFIWSGKRIGERTEILHCRRTKIRR